MALERLDNQSETDMNHYIEALEELLSDFEGIFPSNGGSRGHAQKKN
jgi:hypothetical protein